MRNVFVAVSTVACLTLTAHAISFSDPRAATDAALDAASVNEPRDPACQAMALVSAGSPFPRSAQTLVVRWAGFSNFELVYKNQIILLDAYYDRGTVYPPLGVKASDLKKGDVILIGHGHFDHMSDAASIAARTKAVVAGAPLTVAKLTTQGIPSAQMRSVTGRGGELLRFNGFTVEPILARHGEPDAAVAAVVNPAMNSLLPSTSPEQQTEEAAIRARGTTDARVTAEGTIAYLITLDDGFRIMYRDSAGTITDFERAVMAKIGRVDLAITALLPSYYFARATAQEMDYLRVFRPDVVMPAHHDGATTAGHDALWRTTEPLFQAMRDERPNVVTVSPSYREPVCFNTAFNISRGTSAGGREPK